MALRLILIAALTGTLALGACGKRGDPVRPGEEPKKEEKAG